MERLKLAIQKSGRLHDDTVSLLKQCGMSFSIPTNKLVATVSNFPLELLFLRDDDIPQYVEDNVVDAGILGHNVVIESQKNVKITEELGFSKCRLSLAVSRGTVYKDISFFEKKKIATSYPNLLKNYLQKKNVNATVEEISGSVEIAPGIGLADGICDIVSTGSTLLSNGLVEVESIFNSQAVLIAGNNLNEIKMSIMEQLLFRVRAVNKAKKNKYVLLNVANEKIDEVIRILPGIKSPTILPLAMKGWSSMHSVISEDDFWSVIDRLKAIGAEGILIVPIEKMIA